MATDPTDEAADEVIHLVLSGLSNGTDLDDIASQVAALASEHSLFPGDALIDLAADICERVATRHDITYWTRGTPR